MTRRSKSNDASRQSIRKDAPPPIVVPCDPGTRSNLFCGAAMWNEREQVWTTPGWVRYFTDNDVDAAFEMAKSEKPTLAGLLDAVYGLKHASEAHDMKKLMAAYKQLSSLIELEDVEVLSEVVSFVNPADAERAYQRMEQEEDAPFPYEQAQYVDFALSRVLAVTTEDVQPVVLVEYPNGDQRLAGLFAPNPVAALMARVTFDVQAILGRLRRCVVCKRPFIPKRGTPAACPDCRPTYAMRKKRTPEYKAEEARRRRLQRKKAKREQKRRSKLHRR